MKSFHCPLPMESRWSYFPGIDVWHPKSIANQGTHLNLGAKAFQGPHHIVTADCLRHLQPSEDRAAAMWPQTPSIKSHRWCGSKPPAMLLLSGCPRSPGKQRPSCQARHSKGLEVTSQKSGTKRTALALGKVKSLALHQVKYERLYILYLILFWLVLSKMTA